VVEHAQTLDWLYGRVREGRRFHHERFELSALFGHHVLFVHMIMDDRVIYSWACTGLLSAQVEHEDGFCKRCGDELEESGECWRCIREPQEERQP
jgi:hypothetical protein